MRFCCTIVVPQIKATEDCSRIRRLRTTLLLSFTIYSHIVQPFPSKLKRLTSKRTFPLKKILFDPDWWFRLENCVINTKYLSWTCNLCCGILSFPACIVHRSFPTRLSQLSILPNFCGTWFTFSKVTWWVLICVAKLIKDYTN